jgi:hypothetical protein
MPATRAKPAQSKPAQTLLTALLTSANTTANKRSPTLVDSRRTESLARMVDDAGPGLAGLGQCGRSINELCGM